MRTFDPRTRAVKIIPDPLSFDRWDKRGLVKERLDCRMRSVSSIALSVPGINRLKFDCQEPWNVAHWQPLFQRTVPWCPIFPHPCTKPSTEMVLGSVTEMSEQVSVMVSTTWRQFCWHSFLLSNRACTVEYGLESIKLPSTVARNSHVCAVWLFP